VAKRVSVAKDMIHHDFRTKEQLVEAVFEGANRFCRNNQRGNQARRFTSRGTSAFRGRPDARLPGKTNATPLFLLESVQKQGIHNNKAKATSLYLKVELVLAWGIAEGYFQRPAPWSAAVNLLGLCNYYYAAANNIALMAHHTTDAFDTLSQLSNAREVLALVDRGTEKR
jgi:TetR/AcrR family transcriptional regulator